MQPRPTVSDLHPLDYGYAMTRWATSGPGPLTRRRQLLDMRTAEGHRLEADDPECHDADEHDVATSPSARDRLTVKTVAIVCYPLERVPYTAPVWLGESGH